MSLSEFDDIFKAKQLKAPVDFTQSVMNKIELYEKEKAPVQNIIYPAGLSLIAASLIVLFLNHTPIMDSLVNSFQNTNTYETDTIDLEHVSDSIQYFTLKVDLLLSKPLNFLTKTIIKEDSYYE